MFSDKSFFWLASGSLWTAAVLALALGPQAEQDWLIKTFGDKVLHAVAFTVGCFCWGKALENEARLGRLSPLIAGAIALLVGMLVEYLQSFTPTRQSDIQDVFADLVGIIPAVLVLMLSAGRRRREMSRN